MGVVRQQADINFLNDMVAYMQNLGAANDGKHQNMPSLMWCAAPHARAHTRLTRARAHVLDPGDLAGPHVIIVVTRDRSDRHHSLAALHTGDGVLGTVVLGVCQALAQAGLLSRVAA